MQILRCDTPTESLEPAPLTDLAIHMDMDAHALSAFWSGDDGYVVRAAAPNGDELWFQVVVEADATSDLCETERLRLGALMASVLPLGAGRVAFPVGSSGRTVYRIWRTVGEGNSGRTKIRAVRAARSRRLPA